MAGSFRERAGLQPGRIPLSSPAGSITFVYLNEHLTQGLHAEAYRVKPVKSGDNYSLEPTLTKVTVYDVGFVAPFNSPIPKYTFCAVAQWQGIWVYLHHICPG